MNIFKIILLLFFYFGFQLSVAETTSPARCELAFQSEYKKIDYSLFNIRTDSKVLAENLAIYIKYVLGLKNISGTPTEMIKKAEEAMQTGHNTWMMRHYRFLSSVFHLASYLNNKIHFLDTKRKRHADVIVNDALLIEMVKLQFYSDNLKSEDNPNGQKPIERINSEIQKMVERANEQLGNAYHNLAEQKQTSVGAEKYAYKGVLYINIFMVKRREMNDWEFKQYVKKRLSAELFALKDTNISDMVLRFIYGKRKKTEFEMLINDKSKRSVDRDFDGLIPN